MKIWTVDEDDEDDEGEMIHSVQYSVYGGAWRFYISSDRIFLLTTDSSLGAFVSKISMHDLSLIDQLQAYGDSLGIGYLEEIDTEFMFLPCDIVWWYLIQEKLEQINNKQGSEIIGNNLFVGKNKNYQTRAFPFYKDEDERIVSDTNIIDSLIFTKNGKTHIYCLSCSLYTGNFFSFPLCGEWEYLGLESNRGEYKSGPFRSIPMKGIASVNSEFHDSYCKIVEGPNKNYISFTQFTHLSGDDCGWRFNLFVFSIKEDQIIWGKSIDSKVTEDFDSLDSLDLSWPCSEPVFTFDSSHIIVGTAEGVLIFFETQTGAHNMVKFPLDEYRFDNLAIHPNNYSLWHYQGEEDHLYQLLPDIRVHLNPEDYTSPKVVPQ